MVMVPLLIVAALFAGAAGYQHHAWQGWGFAGVFGGAAALVLFKKKLT